MITLSKEEIYQLVDAYEVSPVNKKIVLFGAGQIGHEAIQYCIDKGIEVSFIVDNNSALWNNYIQGIEIVSPEKIKEQKPYLIILSGNFYKEMAEQLLEYGFNNFISYFLFKGRYKTLHTDYPGASSAEKACNWIIENQQDNGGVSVFAGSFYEYPEVTGYIVPTMLRYGFKEEALAMVKYLESIANADGSFNAAGSDRAYLFDTAQVLRGLNAIQQVTDKYKELQDKVAKYLFTVLKENNGIFPKSYEDDIVVPETIMLFALPPMLEYAQIYKDEEYIELVHKAVKKYLEAQDVISIKTLTHFLAYQIDGLIDMGYKDEVADIIQDLLDSQKLDGSIPAFEGVDWVCITGCSQIAICLYKLNMREPADKIMKWVEGNIEVDGGFLGSIGEGAEYYSDREIAWAVKFYLDAYKLMIKAHFDEEFAAVAPAEIEADDTEVIEVINEIKDGETVLEVGCGKGRILKRVKEKLPKCELYGVDISDGMLAFVTDDIKTEVADIEFLPFKDNSFDVVYTVECIEHSINLKAAVNELIRVCKPNGKVIIIDKQMLGWGRLTTRSWERWPDRNKLETLLESKCQNVKSHVISMKGNDERDDLYVKWIGTKEMVQSEETKRIVFFGAGETGKLGLYYAERSGMKVDLIVDNNSKRWGNSLSGISILNPDILLNNQEKYTVIITVGYEFFDEIREQLVQMNYIEDVDFFEFHKVFLQGNNGFGLSSGVVNIDSNFELVKTEANNKLIISKKDNCVYRLINKNLETQFKEIYKKCMGSHLYDKYLVKTENSNEKIVENYSLCFKHDFIPVFTYAVEWSPQMFYHYTIFMIEFLKEIDKNGMSWLDGHAFNTTFNNGKFIFFDFDAIRLGKIKYFYLQEFINNHIVILLMMSENLIEKAYMYLNNPGQKISIKDVAGYLTEEKLNDFNKMYAQCYQYSVNGDIQKCCDILRDYVLNIQFKQILQSGWNGYQNELYESGDELNWTDKQKTVIEMVRSVKPKTLLDLAGNMGWYEFILHNEIERCIVADLDYNCVDFVFNSVTKNKIQNIYPVYLNLVTPTPAYYRDLHIGDTAIIPWRKSAIDRFKSEMVLALAVMHHLAFAQQLSFPEIIGQFAMYTSRWLIIEFIEREDSVVSPALKNTDFDWYTKENFEDELLKSFNIISVKNSEATRVLYLCEKK